MPMGLYKCNITPRVSMKKPNPGQAPQAQCQCQAGSKPQQVDHVCFTRVDVLPPQTSVLARVVGHCLFVCGVLRFGAKCVAHARNTRKRTSQDSCIPHSHEKAQGKVHSLLFSFLSESFRRRCRNGVARQRIELWLSSGNTN